MKKYTNKILKTTSYIVIALLVGVTAYAGSTLTPPGSPAKTMKSLSDLYQLVNTGSNTPSTEFTTPSTVATTMYSIGDTYDLLKTKITAIDNTKILTGTTILGKVGSMVNKGATSYTPSNATQTIIAGYYNGSGTIATDANLIAGNIKSGTSIFGVTGNLTSLDTSDATAIDSDILNTKTAYVNGSKITGTMTNKVGSATVITPSTADQTIAQGYYGGATGDGKVSGDANLVASNIKSGVSIFGITGTATSGPATLTWQTDPALNLCWSNNAYEISNGCAVSSGFVQTPDTLTTLGAVEYCKYLNADGATLANAQQNIWHLPTYQEFASITDTTIYNNATQVPGFAPYSYYWSGTHIAESTDVAWGWGTYGGDIGGSDKDSQNGVRCVH